MSSPPSKIRIAHDDYHASHVGRTATGDQFFATSPFVLAIKEPGREFFAVYLFHSDGRFKEAIIDDLGTRAAMDADAARQLFERRVGELGRVEFCDTRAELEGDLSASGKKVARALTTPNGAFGEARRVADHFRKFAKKTLPAPPIFRRVGV